MGISGHFCIENFAWRLGMVQSLCEFCQFFCMIFWVQTVPIPPNHRLILFKVNTCGQVCSSIPNMMKEHELAISQEWVVAWSWLFNVVGHPLMDLFNLVHAFGGDQTHLGISKIIHNVESAIYQEWM